MRNLLLIAMAGITLTCIGVTYKVNNTLNSNLKGIPKMTENSYFTGCVDGIVATSPQLPKELVVQACRTASMQFSSMIDKLIND